MASLIKSVLYAARTLARNRLATLGIILALALGIGANTAIFSVVYAAMLRPLPFTDPERLALVFQRNDEWGVFSESVSAPNFVDWRAQNRVFTDLVSVDAVGLTLESDDKTGRLVGAQVSSGFFELLGIRIGAGRVFNESEYGPAGGGVAILSPGFWGRQYGADPEILGRSLPLELSASYELRGNPSGLYTVIGVLDEDISLPNGSKPDIWLPQTFDPMAIHRDATFLLVLGRLKPDVSLVGAQAGMTAVAKRLEKAYPEFNSGWGARVVGLREHLIGDFRRSLTALSIAAGFVLLITCVNVANLLLAKARRRRREISIRSALGARRRDVVRQLLTESVLLALAGGAAGLLLGAALLAWLTRLTSQSVAGLEGAGLHLPVLLFTVVVSILTGLAFGLAPALQATRVDLTSGLKAGAENASSASGRRTYGLVITVMEVAPAIVLLVGAGLIAKSFLRLNQVDPGFDTSRVAVASVELPDERYPNAPDREAFFRETLGRVRSIPGIVEAGAIDSLPLSGDGGNVNFSIADSSQAMPDQILDAGLRAVSPGLFRALEIPVLQGRRFEEADFIARSVIVSESFSRRFWPGGTAVGKRIRFGGAYADAPWREIVGVVGDVRQWGLEWGGEPTIYIPHLQWPSMTIAAQTQGPPSMAIAELRSAILSADETLPLYQVTTMEDLRSRSVADPRFRSILFSLFGGVALLLASIGLYSLMAHSVSGRRREIGVRMALGATRSAVTGEVLRRAMVGVGVGLVLGLGLAFALARFLSNMLYEVEPRDPAIFIAAPLFLGLVGLVATYLPARRSTGVDPVTALSMD